MNEENKQAGARVKPSMRLIRGEAFDLVDMAETAVNELKRLLYKNPELSQKICDTVSAFDTIATGDLFEKLIAEDEKEATELAIKASGNISDMTDRFMELALRLNKDIAEAARDEAKKVSLEEGEDKYASTMVVVNLLPLLLIMRAIKNLHEAYRHMGNIDIANIIVPIAQTNMAYAWLYNTSETTVQTVLDSATAVLEKVVEIAKKKQDDDNNINHKGGRK